MRGFYNNRGFGGPGRPDFERGPERGPGAFGGGMRPGFGPHPHRGRGFRGWGGEGRPEGGLDAMIGRLEQVQARLEGRLEQVKRGLEHLKAERARRQEGGQGPDWQGRGRGWGRGGQRPDWHGRGEGRSQGRGEGRGFGSDSSNTDVSML